MKRWIAAAGAAFGLLSCSANVPGVGCLSDADCGAGARCHQEVCVSEAAQCTRDAECFSGRICFEQRCAQDTRPERCSPACGSSEECVDGACTRGFERVEILSPLPGTVGPSAEARAQLVRRADGVAEAPPSLTLIVEEEGAAAWEVTLTRGQGLQYSGLLEFPEGGVYRLRARLLTLGLESAPVTVAYNVCPQACPAFTECVGRACLPLFEGLSFQEPAVGSVGPRASLRVQAVRRTNAGACEPPAEVVVTATPQGGGAAEEMRLPRVAGTDEYAGEWVPAVEATYALKAHAAEPPLDSGTVSVAVDKTGPPLAIVIESPERQPHETDLELPGAYRRDEQAVIFVTGPADVDAETVELKVAGTTGEISVPLESAGELCPVEGAGYCSVGRVDLWQQPLGMKAARTTFAVRVKGQDRFGNAGPEFADGLPVTRYKWAVDLQGGAIKTSPAIGSDGDVYVGTANTPGKVVAVRPDGTVKWSFTTGGPVLASVVIGEVYGKETVFVAGKAVTGNTGAIWAIEPAATALPGPIPASLSGGPFAAALSLSSPIYPTLWALTDLSGLGLMALEFRPGNIRVASWVEDGSSVPGGASIGTKGADAYFRDNKGNLHSTRLQDGGLSGREGWHVAVGGSFFVSPLVFSDQGHVAGTANEKTFWVSLEDHSTFLQPSPTTLWAPAITREGGLLAGSDDKYMYLLAPESEPRRVYLTGVAFSTPVVGSDGRFYASTRSNNLVAIDPEFYALEWSFALASSSESSSALDCSRDTSRQPIPGRPGVLYVGSDDGKLYAIVTDSRGVDTESPWPKFQHDPRNTGNADTDLAQFKCP